MNRILFFSLTLLFVLNICLTLSAAEKPTESESIKSSNASTRQSIMFLKNTIFHYDEIISLNNPIIDTENESDSRKSPWLAFGLSYLFPGLGQVYNGEYLKAILFPTFFCIGVSLMVMSSPGADFEGQEPHSLIYAGIGIAGGAYIWNLIDAPVSANRINERNKLSGLNIISSDNEKYILKLKPDLYKNSTALTFYFGF